VEGGVPFSNLAGDGPARVVLEQVDDTQFRILVPFKYIDAAGEEYDVPASDPNDPNDVTDLSSVPWMLRWLVASYGQHTTAALLHDRLVRPGMTLPERVEADTVFFRALEESGNNWMRHRLMWAAVAVGGTMWSHKRKLCLVFFAHLVVFWAAVLWATGLLPWLDPLWAGIAAAVLFLLGFAWRLAPGADPSLSWWMWLAAAVGVGLIVPPCALIAASVRVVQLIDHLVAAVKGAGPQAYEQPSPLKPPDLAKAEARKASVMWTAEPPAG
jgi:hypothetical protein